LRLFHGWPHKWMRLHLRLDDAALSPSQTDSCARHTAFLDYSRQLRSDPRTCHYRPDRNRLRLEVPCEENGSQVGFRTVGTRRLAWARRLLSFANRLACDLTRQCSPSNERSLLAFRNRPLNRLAIHELALEPGRQFEEISACHFANFSGLTASRIRSSMLSFVIGVPPRFPNAALNGLNWAGDLAGRFPRSALYTSDAIKLVCSHSNRPRPSARLISSRREKTFGSTPTAPALSQWSRWNSSSRSIRSCSFRPLDDPPPSEMPP